MRFDILTLFPEMFGHTLGGSIIGRAQSDGKLTVNCVNIRDFAGNKHNKVDDYPYGGGAGMIMQPQPIYDAYMSVAQGLNYKPFTVYLTPQGKVFRQSTAKRLSKMKHIVLLCGHYEGVDQRVLDEIVDMEISIGDYVLTGGEIPAMAVVDATARLLPGVLSSTDAYSNESLQGGLLEHPQYTRPPEWMGREVPEILISGHHGNIEKWKREQSIGTTLKKRRSLLSKANLTDKEKKLLD